VVLVFSALSGLAVLILAALVWHESFPSMRGTLRAALGGISGALGIAAFYRALSLGHTAIVAPTAAVIGTASPVVVSISIAGWPSGTQLLGFALALAGIWLVSTAPAMGAGISRQGFVLACLGGLGFAGFFVFLGLVERGKIFTPLIIARSMTLCVGLVLVGLQRLRLPSVSQPMGVVSRCIGCWGQPVLCAGEAMYPAGCGGSIVISVSGLHGLLSQRAPQRESVAPSVGGGWRLPRRHRSNYTVA
jgi:uncharacterized membrane protein